MTELAVNLKRLREERKMTQRELARLSGIDNSTISLLEAGRRPNPTIEVLNSLSIGLDIDFFELLEELGVQVYNRDKDLEDTEAL